FDRFWGRSGSTRRVLGAVYLKPKARPILFLSPSHFSFFPLPSLSSSFVFSRWFFVLVVLVLRWCRPVRAGDVFMLLGARRRWSFLREAPTGWLYLWRRGFPLSVFTSRVVVTTNSRMEFSTVLYFRTALTSQQQQGAHRAKETGR
ncbi:hypothetical protein Taro_032950, partial [Colocasia esculenta]|nr:hypothetical protein [Colocasia esculenta]